MGVKIYKKNNYCIVDNGSKKEFFAGDEMSIASFDGGEWVIWNTAKQTESFSFNYTMVEDENGTPVGDASAVEEYLTLNTNFKAASGGSGAAWGAITGVLTEQTDLQTELDNKVNKNTAVAGATKAKITFDSKGLVTNGENLSASDIPNIAQTQVTNLVTDLSNKQESLISGTNIKTINGDSVLGSGDLVISGGGGGGTNPTSGFIPINDSGTFVDSKIQQGTLYGMPTYEFNGLAKISAVLNGLNFLNLDVMNNFYSFGLVDFPSGSPSVTVGMGITDYKVVISNYSTWDPTFGLFQSNSYTGVTSLGQFPGASIGVNSYGYFSMFVGSLILSGNAPSNTATPTNWIFVKDENGNEYRIPAYQ